MAKSKSPGNPTSKGRIKARLRSSSPTSGKWLKRDMKTGQILEVRVDHKPFKGPHKAAKSSNPAKGRRGGSGKSASKSAPAEFLVAQRYLSGDGLVDVDRVVEQFGMTKAALAEALGFADYTLQRFSRSAAPKTQQRLREMLEILTRVERWAGGMPQALGWYRGQGIPALGDQTAEALVKSDQAGIVRSYLDGVAAGSFA